ncbi:serine acetyltransferase [Cellulomonas sp. APG4]|uniref:serine O-acetyltransferase n=1 Tax=Cellulomonas sp. APG4 TaxID=1538656 RepID=UPI00137A773E|nr:DapH/DapD/GlmU-related protein [Cellulomonas sp. APG4]NCT92605.1 serine acetyltransferase [Cellulomonas sp. APG4]
MTLLAQLREDVRANRGQTKGQLVVAAYRVAHAVRRPLDRRPQPWALPVGVLYRVLVEWVLTVEIPWGTVVGRRLRVFHGAGIVVNDRTVLGDDVTLRQNVTLGNVRPDGPCPVIGDRVELGAGCIVLGGIRVGDDARVGAGAVVTKDVPAGATVVGNPARILEPRA